MSSPTYYTKRDTETVSVLPVQTIFRRSQCYQAYRNFAPQCYLSRFDDRGAVLPVLSVLVCVIDISRIIELDYREIEIRFGCDWEMFDSDEMKTGTHPNANAFISISTPNRKKSTVTITGHADFIWPQLKHCWAIPM